MDPKLFSLKVSSYSKALSAVSEAIRRFMESSGQPFMCRWGDIGNYRDFSAAMKMPVDAIRISPYEARDAGWQMKENGGFCFGIVSPDSNNPEDPIQDTVHVNTVGDLFAARNRLDRAIMDLEREADEMRRSTVTMESKRVSGDFIVCDPCKVITGAEYDKFLESRCTESSAVGLSEDGDAVCAPTGFGDGVFTLLSSNANGTSSRGEYSVDSGMHGIFPLDKAKKSNPLLSSCLSTMPDEAESDEAVVVRDFKGTISVDMSPEGETTLSMRPDSGESVYFTKGDFE